MFFTHDTFGLGHVRRCLHIMHALAEKISDASFLLITGSPVVETLPPLPANADYIKIPTIVKTGAKGSQPPHLPIALPEVQHMRERLIENIIAGYQPDIFVVDNFPLGIQGELLPALHAAKKMSCRLVLGLRDIVDSPEIVCAEWKRMGTYEILERYYDRILVYGIPNVLDTVKAYNLPASVASKLYYCGYVTEQSPKKLTTDEVHHEIGFKDKFILATGGGGGDALPLLQTFIAAMKFIPGYKGVIFTGPLMGSGDRRILKEQVHGLPNIVLRQSVRDLRGYFHAAEMVVSMCGYNIAAEILVQRARAVVAPRTWRYGEHNQRGQTNHEWEQIMRARALAKLGLVQLIEPEELKPRLLAHRILQTLKSRGKKKTELTINVQGLSRTVKHILDLAPSPA